MLQPGFSFPISGFEFQVSPPFPQFFVFKPRTIFPPLDVPDITGFVCGNENGKVSEMVDTRR
jgi:hypothetical protein